MQKNPLIKEFIKLNLVHNKNLKKISDRTRDKKIKVWQDKKTKVILLDRNLTSNNYYKKKKINIKSKNYDNNLHLTNDAIRRVNQFKKILKNKSVLDFGCAYGDFLSYLKNSKDLYGIEIREQCINHIKKNKKYLKIFPDLSFVERKFDIITLFHVLEHMPKQIQILKQLKKKIKSKGKIIIEVPHANDILFKIEEFKKFSLWSEHLVLHTKKSLKIILQKAGFKKIKINYFQRYNLNNHMGWMLFNKADGHVFLKKFMGKNSIKKYDNYLIKNKISDTLIAIATA